MVWCLGGSGALRTMITESTVDLSVDPEAPSAKSKPHRFDDVISHEPAAFIRNCKMFINVQAVFRAGVCL